MRETDMQENNQIRHYPECRKECTFLEYTRRDARKSSYTTTILIPLMGATSGLFKAGNMVNFTLWDLASYSVLGAVLAGMAGVFLYAIAATIAEKIVNDEICREELKKPKRNYALIAIALVIILLIAAYIYTHYL